MELSRRELFLCLPFLLPSLSAYHLAGNPSFRRDTYFQCAKTPELPAFTLCFMPSLNRLKLGKNAYLHKYLCLYVGPVPKLRP
jgi:hypothetical protein